MKEYCCFFSSDVWILTTGQKVGVSNVIGQSLYRHRLLKRCVIRPTVIGLTGWNLITGCRSSPSEDQVKQISYELKYRFRIIC